MTRALSILVLACPALAVGCAETGGEGVAVVREFQQFQREVYPVLLRDCAFPACHGDHDRFFRVFGPGRVRLPGETTIPEALDQPTGDELSTSYALALSMIDPDAPKQSPLIRKPLAVEAGGSGHYGVDQYDRNVYRTEEDAGYLIIARWVYTEPAPAPEAP